MSQLLMGHNLALNERKTLTEIFCFLVLQTKFIKITIVILWVNVKSQRTSFLSGSNLPNTELGVNSNNIQIY